MIVSAPTSSGKTLVGEIAVLAALRSGIRAIYLVSHKALADQKYLDFVSRFGEKSPQPLASVGLNTGDRAEGEIDARLLVATYEKALGLFLSGLLRPADALIVADELQILGEKGRGPEIESLCAVLRSRGLRQFIALTATIENPQDLAGWMNCDLVQSFQRDIPLFQEIWYAGRTYQVVFGQDDGHEIPLPFTPASNLPDVIDQLLSSKRGPILVFLESRREASDLAANFAQRRARAADGIAVAEQLELFSEPTESSERLKGNAERRIAFHTADLSPQERQVIEAGFLDARFDVCFATSTLAAGVNFPFRTIVFPKLTYQWGDRAGTMISKSEYRNMSGRAGRLGMHADGFAVLLPRNQVELSHANCLVEPSNDLLVSQLVSLSLRKTILMLVASGLASQIGEIIDFFKNSLYWHQTLERNPRKLQDIELESAAAIDWLTQAGLLQDGTNLLVTPIGHAAALSGLLPSTAVQLTELLRHHLGELEAQFDDWIDGLVYAICRCDEFCGERPSRFLPWPNRVSYDGITFFSTKKLPTDLNRADPRSAQCAQAISLYVQGIADRKIAHSTKLSSGSIHRLSIDVAWVLDGLHKLSSSPDLGCSQGLSNQIALLRRRVQWGAPAEALDVIRIAERHAVPGFGRQRAMALISQGISTLHDVLGTAKDKLAAILRSDRRAEELLTATSSAVGLGPDRLIGSHDKVAKSLGMEDLVSACNNTNGVDYERSIFELLRIEASWIVTALDDGVRQNVPDLLVQLGDTQILVECKTCTKSPPLVKKEEAWAVMQKAADFDRRMHRVTLGKPGFDETSKKKAAASQDITLIEHSTFIEGLLRVHGGSLLPEEFLAWLSRPGVTELDRLGGTPTF